MKLILGLIWTLILHYQISMGFGLHEASDKSQSPKQALLQYLNVSLPFCFPLYTPVVKPMAMQITCKWFEGTG